MITIAIGAILIVIGVPTMRGVIENGRIRAAGESWKYGLALARTEAIRRNTQVEFVTDADGWQVLNLADGTVLHQAAGNEGAVRPGIAVVDAGARTRTGSLSTRSAALSTPTRPMVRSRLRRWTWGPPMCRA